MVDADLETQTTLDVEKRMFVLGDWRAQGNTYLGDDETDTVGWMMIPARVVQRHIDRVRVKEAASA